MGSSQADPIPWIHRFAVDGLRDELAERRRRVDGIREMSNIGSTLIDDHDLLFINVVVHVTDDYRKCTDTFDLAAHVMLFEPAWFIDITDELNKNDRQHIGSRSVRVRPAQGQGLVNQL